MYIKIHLQHPYVHVHVICICIVYVYVYVYVHVNVCIHIQFARFLFNDALFFSALCFDSAVQHKDHPEDSAWILSALDVKFAEQELPP